MWNIRSQIMDASQLTEINYIELEKQDAKEIRLDLQRRFPNVYNSTKPANNDEEYSSIRDPDAWKWIADFSDETRVLLFFSEDDDIAMFSFENTSDLVRVLSECIGF